MAVSPGICFEETQQPALIPQPSPAKTASCTVLALPDAQIRRPVAGPCQGDRLSRPEG